MKELLFLLLCFFAKQVTGQKLQGYIYDKETLEPIGYAHVYIPSLEDATYSNEEGMFDIDLPSGEDYIIISHIYYGKNKISIDKNIDKYKIGLVPSSTSLDELVITDINPYELVDMALKKAVGHRRKSTNVKSFYRQITWNDSIPTEVQEIFYDSKVSNRGVEAKAIKQGRYAVRKEKEDQVSPNLTFANITSLINSVKVYTEKLGGVIIPITTKTRKYYSLKIKKVSKMGIVEIDCIPISKSSSPIFEGKIYISKNTHDILGMSGYIDNSLGLIVENKQYSIKKIRYIVEVSYRQFDGHIPSLSYIKLDCNADFLFKNEFEKNLKVVSSLFFYGRNTKNKNMKKNKSSKLLGKDDRSLIEASKYNPDFWKNNPVIKYTPQEQRVISEFNNSNSFGNLLN